MEPSHRVRTALLNAAIAVALLGLVVIALAVPDARLAAGAALVVSLLLLGLGRRRRERPDAESDRPRHVSFWPSAGIRSVVEAMPEPALLTDARLMLRFRNTVSLKAFGETALGDPIAMRFRQPQFLAAAQEAIASGETRSVDFVERSPIDRSWSVDILAIREGGQDAASFFLFLFRDRTAERRIERMRTDFVANASHELRTPLSSLIGFIETLQGPAREDATARMRFLDIMRVEAGRMSRLIDDLLSLSRIETKAALGAGDTADIAEVLRVVAELLGPTASTAGLAITMEGIGSGERPVAGDRDELIQVLSNLIENGCKYAAAGGRLLVGLREIGERELEIFVQDFGPGIAARHVPRLTERFYRIEEDGDGVRARGTGLGLSIVRNILARHGSRLLVTSTLGEGSTFSFRLRRSPKNGKTYMPQLDKSS